MNAKKILVNGVSEAVFNYLKDIFSEKYEILRANELKEAVSYILNYCSEIEAVILDTSEVDSVGFEVADYLTSSGLSDAVPILMLVGEPDLAKEEEAVAAGAFDVFTKPYSRFLLNRRIKNAMESYNLKNHFEEVLRKQIKTAQGKNIQLVEALGTIVEFRDLESGDHIRRIQGLTYILLTHAAIRFPEEMLTDEKIDLITTASAIHDIGKIAIPNDILLKPGKLTPEEFQVMKTHTIKGCELIQEATAGDGDYATYCYNIAKYHHERYDGSGYPEGLVGDAIPFEAQVISIVDVYEALVSRRCYKDAYEAKKSFDMIVSGECGAFHPLLLEAFLESRDEFEKLIEVAIPDGRNNE